MVFGPKDICQNSVLRDVAVFIWFTDQTRRNAGYWSENRYSGIHEGKTAATYAGH